MFLIGKRRKSVSPPIFLLPTPNNFQPLISKLSTLNSQLSTLNSIILTPPYASALQLLLQGEHQGQFHGGVSVDAPA